ncbi:non-hydrolyzing UDP-N-acetylglucosamine 2-epimerase [Candidatus Lokiarchaeum ossiferum]|uniref:non-hydrolyzing UDP-N-acetylglucosamine 2-epimerase n=1 Tax=Candidatus Lokiarchaeum ossiferum TaxID=2951803 RepID=UPI00352C5028
MIVTGTRPELIKVSVLIKLMKIDPDIDLVFVHSGQHYDEKMFGTFIKDLHLPLPDYNLNVGSHPNSIQTGKMLISLYEIINKMTPDIILSQGDTNTVLASALTAFKNFIPFGHIEAGIRSFDMRMPEEINRILTGCCSIFNFAPTKLSVENLLNDGILPKHIYLVGNPIVDAVNENLQIAQKYSHIEKKLNLTENNKFALLTMHRPSNVDNIENLQKIVHSLLKLKEVDIIFPAHPRTKKKLKDFDLLDKMFNSSNITIIDPVNYLDMLKLMSLSYMIVTDSGGLQEEAVILKKPCITLRENTERPESVEVGANILVGNDELKIQNSINQLWNDTAYYKSMIPLRNPFGDGKTSERIIKIIKEAFVNKQLSMPFISFKKISPHCKLIKTEDFENIPISVEQFEQKNGLIIMEIFGELGNPVFPEKTLILEKKMMLKVRYI